MDILHVKDGITYAHVTTNDPALIREAKMLRHDIFVACDFITPTATRTIEDKPDEDCHYVVAIAAGQLIGTIRLSKPPFKVLEALAKDHLEIYPTLIETVVAAQQQNSWELGALAVRPKVKTGRSYISGGLYKGVYLFSLDQAIDNWFIDIDKAVGESLSRLGWQLTPIAPEHNYMGSMTVPAIMAVAEQLPSIEAKNSDYAMFILER